VRRAKSEKGEEDFLVTPNNAQDVTGAAGKRRDTRLTAGRTEIGSKNGEVSGGTWTTKKIPNLSGD